MQLVNAELGFIIFDNGDRAGKIPVACRFAGGEHGRKIGILGIKKKPHTR